MSAEIGSQASQAPAAAGTVAPSERGYVVTRLDRLSRGALVGFAALVVLLAFVPFSFGSSTQNTLTGILLLVAMASLWNLLAGYAGLISFGQQAFLGVGAYSVLVLTRSGMNGYVAIPFAALIALVIAVPLSVALFRTRGAYFAIATWVVAEAFRLLVITIPALGGGEGASLPTALDYSPTVRTALTYWASLVVAVASLAAIWFLMRSRTGLDAGAVRDDELAASSLGVGTDRARRIPYLVSAAGFGAVGAVIFLNALRVEPASIFSVNYSANAFFMTVIGGVGTIEGPVVGALVFYALQEFLSGWGEWYLVLLGVVAIAVMLFMPEGLWGRLSRRFDLVLFPIGYRLRQRGGSRDKR
ncbi:MAG TPA: branched-chain amino acid ABC transporter permease [Solirubrobacteraceae bacterium]|nr:branched-chain amino acid ABC transporter permease [Solirubrobacteraceae bacterium]